LTQDKISFPEIKVHLEDNFKIDNVALMHWLKPGRELSNGLLLLVDDGSCKLMADQTTDGEIADIYVQELAAQETKVDRIAEQVFDDKAEEIGGAEIEWIYISPQRNCRMRMKKVAMRKKIVKLLKNKGVVLRKIVTLMMNNRVAMRKKIVTVLMNRVAIMVQMTLQMKSTGNLQMRTVLQRMKK
jgi:hypothetical protein